MSNDPFTLDMFGNTALTSGLGLGMTGFSGHDPFAANDDDPDPTPPAPAPALPIAAARKSAPRKQGARSNFYLDDEGRGLAAGWKERAKANVAAILIAGEIEKQDRPATSEEQRKLIRFTHQEQMALLAEDPHTPWAQSTRKRQTPDEKAAMIASATNRLRLGQRVRITGTSPSIDGSNERRVGRVGVVWRTCCPPFDDHVHVNLDLVEQERSEKIVFVDLRDVEPIDGG